MSPEKDQNGSDRNESEEQDNELLASSNASSAHICPLNCQGPPKPGDKLVSCMLCARNYHAACVNVKSKAANPIFTCSECSSTFISLKDIVKELTTRKTVPSVSDTMEKTFSDKMEKMQESIKSCLEANAKLVNENVKLQSQVASLTVELNKLKWSNFRNTDLGKPELLLSDFTLSDVVRDNLSNTQIIHKPDITVENMSKELEKLPNDKYDRVIIQVGSNDICEKPVADVIPHFAKLLDVAKTKGAKVAVSSICPRPDKPLLKDRVEGLNAHIQGACSDHDHDFMDNTPSFTLSDGSINDGYYLGNGPQLSKAGTNKVTKNLKLRTRDGIVDVTKRSGQTSDSSPVTSQKKFARSRRNHPETRKTNNHVSHSSPQDVHYNRDACYFCNEPGHATDTCRHNGPVSCHFCGAKGHKEKHHSRYYSKDSSY